MNSSVLRLEDMPLLFVQQVAPGADSAVNN